MGLVTRLSLKHTPSYALVYSPTDAEYKNRIIFHDNTLNLPVVARQHHPDPNYAPHTVASRVAGD